MYYVLSVNLSCCVVSLSCHHVSRVILSSLVSSAVCQCNLYPCLVKEMLTSQRDLVEYRTVPGGPHLHVLVLQDAHLLLHLADVAGGLGHLPSLQVTLSQQLLDVLLLLLQSLLQSRGARDLTGVAGRRLRQLGGERAQRGE